MIRRDPRQCGHTLLELLIVVSIFALFGAVFTDGFASSSALVDDSRVRHRADERLRRNMEAVANLLRGADIDTVTGFASNGIAVDQLHFARVDTVDRDGPIYVGTESIEWRAEGGSVDGVANPGRLVWVLDGVETIIATRVPRYSFEAEFGAGALMIRMSTYYSREGRVSVARGETAVALRN